MKVSVLAAADWTAVARLCADVAASALNPAFFNWSFETALAEFALSETLVIKKGVHVLAFLSYRSYPDRFEIMALATENAELRQGLGGQLLRKLQLIAAQRSLPVCLEVHENNQQAVNFYLKNHFSVVGSRKSYYSDGGNAVIMQSNGNGDIQS